MTGPYEVLASAPGFTVDFVAKRGTRCDPTTDWPSCRRAPWPMRRPATCWWRPAGRARMMPSSTPNGWISRAGRLAARYVFGICTGSLLLGAAGLRGRRASSHWRARELLSRFGAIPSDERMCVDGHIYTAGGVTSGIDMGLRVVADLCGEDVAKLIQLQVEYDPEPPFPGGTPKTSDHRAALPGAIAGALREPVGEGGAPRRRCRADGAAAAGGGQGRQRRPARLSAPDDPAAAGFAA